MRELREIIGEQLMGVRKTSQVHLVPEEEMEEMGDTLESQVSIQLS